MTPRLFTKISRSLARDRDLPLGARLAKGRRYVAASVLGASRLRGCDRVGARARVMGRPTVRNDGFIAIGDDLVLNARYAACELAAAPGAELRIGHGVGLNFGALVSATRAVTIGDGVSIGPYAVIADAERPDGADAQPIVIGDGVWLAGRVTVRPGARIGAGSVITAGSVVEGEIPSGMVAGGTPARVLRPVASTLVASTPVAPSAPPLHPRPSNSASPTPPAQPRLPALRGVILADFTTGELATRLADPADAPALAVIAAPYGQVMQSLLTPADDEGTDFAVVWTRPDQISPAFGRLLQGEAADDAEILADVDAFCDALARGAARFRVVLVPTWTVPAEQRGLGMLDARPGGSAWTLARMNQRLMERVAPSPHVFVLDAARWQAAAGRNARTAAKGWYVGKIAFPAEVIAEAARDVKAAVRGALGQARKLLVLDLDDTLWGGIVGDLGWEHLRLGGPDPEGEALADFQRAVKRLTRRGVVLAIASKNTESVALEAIRNHPEMVLRPDDFVAWRINWHDKARNIADIATELNLGLQSVVFIDDNPAERARVREALPEVLVPEWPADKLLYPSAFAALRCFDVPAVSAEDAARTALYAAEQRRNAVRHEVGSVDDWLAALGVRVRLEPLGPANAPRATQLLNKTNQLNLSTRRLSEPEFLAWAAEPGHEVWAAHVGDRFGDAGLTGLLGLERDGDTCRIVDFVLSCRVMGRKVEDTLAHFAVERAQTLGAAHVVARYRPTPKNAPCLTFWRSSGFGADVDPADPAPEAGVHFTWDASRPYARPAHVALEATALEVTLCEATP
ncbi:MAG TPA: HAD-IIIC family phosphatase [Gemmatirosa sp.]